MDTLIVPSRLLKIPRRNLIESAIQKLVLRPNRVLNTTLRSIINDTTVSEDNFENEQDSYWQWESGRQGFETTDTEDTPINIIGFRPYRSANHPQKNDVNALPIINEDPNNRKERGESPSLSKHPCESAITITNKRAIARNETENYPKILHRSQYPPLSQQCESLLSANLVLSK